MNPYKQEISIYNLLVLQEIVKYPTSRIIFFTCYKRMPGDAGNYFYQPLRIPC
jgi:hypothetical protein